MFPRRAGAAQTPREGRAGGAARGSRGAAKMPENHIILTASGTRARACMQRARATARDLLLTGSIDHQLGGAGGGGRRAAARGPRRHRVACEKRDACDAESSRTNEWEGATHSAMRAKTGWACAMLSHSHSCCASADWWAPLVRGAWRCAQGVGADFAAGRSRPGGAQTTLLVLKQWNIGVICVTVQQRK